jgi:hypothetical protein
MRRISNLCYTARPQTHTRGRGLTHVQRVRDLLGDQAAGGISDRQEVHRGSEASLQHVLQLKKARLRVLPTPTRGWLQPPGRSETSIRHLDPRVGVYRREARVLMRNLRCNALVEKRRTSPLPGPLPHHWQNSRLALRSLQSKHRDDGRRAYSPPQGSSLLRGIQCGK